MAKVFPEDHVIEALRGLPVPNRRDILRAAAKRAAYLQEKIALRASLGQPIMIMVDELAAISCLVETYTKEQEKVKVG